MCQAALPKVVGRFEMEMMLEKKLNLAILAHRQDDVSRAEHLYEEILGIAPRHPHANHNLGVLLTSLKRTHEAISYLKAATEIDGTVHQFWFSYFDALIKTRGLADLAIAFEDGKSNGLTAEQIEPFMTRINPAVHRKRPLEEEPAGSGATSIASPSIR